MDGNTLFEKWAGRCVYSEQTEYSKQQFLADLLALVGEDEYMKPSITPQNFKTTVIENVEIEVRNKLRAEIRKRIGGE